ncbi:hypothetical protein RchiOBHm_Chr4g0389871 [Rosa chinensis]|uniref:Uncharacterized protein n=1 Tax=Rosa chinensis TaxID=74649 RepID=A0A2P6QQ73_ROSCH|nr:hypothetical protein RchiOBHm_Chr4g0389871 [Rosa chinensis]
MRCSLLQILANPSRHGWGSKQCRSAPPPSGIFSASRCLLAVTQYQSLLTSSQPSAGKKDGFATVIISRWRTLTREVFSSDFGRIRPNRARLKASDVQPSLWRSAGQGDLAGIVWSDLKAKQTVLAIIRPVATDPVWWLTAAVRFAGGAMLMNRSWQRRGSQAQSIATLEFQSTKIKFRFNGGMMGEASTVVADSLKGVAMVLMKAESAVVENGRLLSHGRVPNSNWKPKTGWVPKLVWRSTLFGVFWVPKIIGMDMRFFAQVWTQLMASGALGFRIWDPGGLFQITTLGWFFSLQIIMFLLHLDNGSFWSTAIERIGKGSFHTKLSLCRKCCSLLGSLFLSELQSLKRMVHNSYFSGKL